MKRGGRLVRISFVWNLNFKFAPLATDIEIFRLSWTCGVFFLARYTLLYIFFFYCNTTYSIFGDDSPQIETERKREREWKKEKERENKCISMREREGETRGKEGVSERDERKRTTIDAREGTAKEGRSYRLPTQDAGSSGKRLRFSFDLTWFPCSESNSVP